MNGKFDKVHLPGELQQESPQDNTVLLVFDIPLSNSECPREFRTKTSFYAVYDHLSHHACRLTNFSRERSR